MCKLEETQIIPGITFYLWLFFLKNRKESLLICVPLLQCLGTRDPKILCVVLTTRN